MPTEAAKSASVKKRGFLPVPHEAASDIDEVRASKFASVSHVTPHAARMRRGPGAGSSTCPTISIRISTDPMPPTGAFLTAETYIAKSCPCKNRSTCESSHVINHCLLELVRAFFCATIDTHTPPRAPFSFTVLLLAMVLMKNSPPRKSNREHIYAHTDVLNRSRARVRVTKHSPLCYPMQDHGAYYVRRSAAFGVGWATHLAYLQRERGTVATGGGTPAIAIGGCAQALAGGAPVLATGGGTQALATGGSTLTVADGAPAVAGGGGAPEDSCGGGAPEDSCGGGAPELAAGVYHAGSRGRSRRAGFRAPRIRVKNTRGRRTVCRGRRRRAAVIRDRRRVNGRRRAGGSYQRQHAGCRGR